VLSCWLLFILPSFLAQHKSGKLPQCFRGTHSVGARGIQAPDSGAVLSQHHYWMLQLSWDMA